MNLAQTLLGLGKGAANATGLPYLLDVAIDNPIRELSAQLTGNKQALKNAQQSSKNQHDLKKWAVNSAAALALPTALSQASKFVWKPPVGQPGYIPFVQGPANTAARVGPNARYTMGDIAEYKFNKNYLNPKDWNGINQSARELSKKFNIDLVNGSPVDINNRVADFLARFNGL